MGTFFELGLEPQGDRAFAPTLRLPERAHLKQMLAQSAPRDIEDFASDILHCAGCARLLSLLADRPQTANTLSDLAHLLGESEDVVEQGLRASADQGALQRFTAAGTTFYALTHNQQALARISAFLGWRRQMIQNVHWLLGVLEANRH